MRYLFFECNLGVLFKSPHRRDVHIVGPASESCPMCRWNGSGLVRTSTQEMEGFPLPIAYSWDVWKAHNKISGILDSYGPIGFPPITV